MFEHRVAPGPALPAAGGSATARALLAALAVLAALWTAPSATAVAAGDGARLSPAPPRCARTGTERVRTDKDRYPHHDIVQVSGSDYARACAVTVRVTRPNGSVVIGDGSRTAGSDTVITSGSGRLSYDYRLSDIDGYYRIDVLGAAGSVLASREFADAFGLSKLFLNSKTGSENYVFTAGNTVVVTGSVDPADTANRGRAYRFVFKDPSGAVRTTTTCTRDGANGANVSASYAVQATDPVSNGAPWSAVLQQFVDPACATVEKTAALAFAVARSRTFADAALANQQDFFKVGAAPSVTVTGLSPATVDWSTVWLRGGGAIACQNTVGADRPDADAAGLLPAGSGTFLAYPPRTGGSEWNLQANYDGTCAAPTSANQGSWTVKLTADATHFVTLPAFTVDAVTPTSATTSPVSASTASFTVSYTASDAGTSVSGLGRVDLYAKGPGATAYTNVATDSAPASSGSFSFTATQGDGVYSFYTVATDKAGNVEAAPSAGDSTTALDTVAPTSAAASPATASADTWTVSYTADDPGTSASGLATIALYVKGPRDSVYTLTATDSAPGPSGAFGYTATKGNGDYSFYTVATDKAGSVEAAPGTADATTTLSGPTPTDTTAPSAAAGTPRYAISTSFTIGYTAADPGTGASGVAQVELYARAPGATSFTRIATDTSGNPAGSFAYDARDGDGTYAFYALATDNAGNAQPAPAVADTTTTVDTVTPTSSATAPPYSSANVVTVSYTASDPGPAGSSLAEVDLLVRGPADSGYRTAAVTTTPASSGSFAFTADQGNGTYSFSTRATDKAGNVEAPAAVADSTTKIDPAVGQVEVADEVHYTFTGPASVAFAWRGAPTDIRYGRTADYGATASATTPAPLPWSSPGPFQEVELTQLDASATYHYSIGGGPDHTFTTAPTGDFRFDVEADVGSTAQFSRVATTQAQIASDNPAFVLVPGDLTYSHPYGPVAVDTHFNDVMTWSTTAAYMPAWGNHEYEDPANDDLRNYKGRFILPHAQTSPGAPSTGCCGDDWSWFDAGGVRFISYPEPYTSGVTWTDWQARADAIFATAQTDPTIHFIVTFGHRPAFSTGLHPGETALATILNNLGDKYDKYRLNVNGHSHDYERYEPIHGVTHVTTGGGGAPLEPPWNATDARTVFRAMHLEHLRVDVSATGMRVDAICGPATSADDVSCVQGSVMDSVTFGTQPPPPPPTPSTLYVAKNDPNCSDIGSGTATRPFCSLGPAASRVTFGQAVRVAAGTYPERVVLSSSGTATAPITFTAAPGATVTVTGGRNGFYTNGQSYVTIQGFTVSGTSEDGIVVSKNSSHITVRGNRVTNCGQAVSGLTARGIRVDISNDDVVANNTVDHNTDYGIYVVGGSTRTQITGNHVFANARVFQRAASGIRIHDSSYTTISDNVSHDNEDSGIELVTGSPNNLVVDNTVYDNGDHGIDDTGSSPDNTVIGNAVYRNATAGIDFEGSATGAVAENNIAVDNGINSPRTKGNIRVDSTSTMGTRLDYNLVYLTVPGRNYEWGIGYDTLAQMQFASGQEAHSIQADPRWTSPSSAAFELQPGSPAIDSANSDIVGAADTDADGNSRIDDPLTVNTGAGRRSYDDRGPYEYEPRDHPPLAALTVSPSSGAINLDVTADASRSSDADGLSPISSYRFDFGDGSSIVGPQDAPAATHAYRAAGTYTVTLTVKDTAGLSTTATATVTVRDDAPTAALSVLPASGPAPLTATADASGSADTDATPIAGFSFDWGDGSAPTGPQPGATATHTYASPGTYTVTVTVTDAAGQASQAATSVTAFGANVPPTAALSVSPSTGNVDLAVTADASASTDPDNQIVSYAFAWGDGSAPTDPQSSPQATHSYTAAGAYTVTVTATDAGGASSRATARVTVADPAPVAQLTVSASSAMAPVDVTADASASADTDATPIASYGFAWGDGSATTGPQTSATATHTYATAGSYTVTVTVRDTAGQATTATAQVVAKPNLVGNPGFESALTGWNTSGSIAGVTLSRLAGGHTGGWSAKLVNGSTASGTCTLNDSPNWVNPTVAGRYNASIWVRGDTAGATLKLRITEYSGTTNLGSASAGVTLTTSWQKVSVTYTTVSPGSSLDFNTYVTGAPPGTCFWGDDVGIYLT